MSLTGILSGFKTIANETMQIFRDIRRAGRELKRELGIKDALTQDEEDKLSDMRMDYIKAYRENRPLDEREAILRDYLEAVEKYDKLNKDVNRNRTWYHIEISHVCSEKGAQRR